MTTPNLRLIRSPEPHEDPAPPEEVTRVFRWRNAYCGVCDDFTKQASEVLPTAVPGVRSGGSFWFCCRHKSQRGPE